jgi:hypothetical protein
VAPVREAEPRNGFNGSILSGSGLPGHPRAEFDVYRTAGEWWTEFSKVKKNIHPFCCCFCVYVCVCVCVTYRLFLTLPFHFIAWLYMTKWHSVVFFPHYAFLTFSLNIWSSIRTYLVPLKKKNPLFFVVFFFKFFKKIIQIAKKGRNDWWRDMRCESCLCCRYRLWRVCVSDQRWCRFIGQIVSGVCLGFYMTVIHFYIDTY